MGPMTILLQSCSVNISTAQQQPANRYLEEATSPAYAERDSRHMQREIFGIFQERFAAYFSFFIYIWFAIKMFLLLLFYHLEILYHSAGLLSAICGQM